MDRDATPAPTSPADALPPHAPEFVRITGLIGVGMTAGALILRMVADSAFEQVPGAITGAQLALVFLGTLTAGAALSMRPDLWWAWGLAAAAAGLSSVGLPESWDSFPPLFRTLCGVGIAGAVFCVISIGWRVAIGSALVMFHFLGIMTAATAPPPQPWIGDQMWTRVYNPYLQFIYMRNAYQFYSPNPGPASVLAFLLKTETEVNGRKEYQTEWVVIPKRPADVRDPLGLSYYRRLSLTEQVASGTPGLAIPTEQFEKTEMWLRRYNKSGQIPFHPIDNINGQYRLPRSDIGRYILPSYASHIIIDRTPDPETAAKTTVKVYRLEHQTMHVEQFVTRLPNGTFISPYHPGNYRPYFLGEFNARGDLVNPQEELLYWLLPILPRFPGSGDPVKETYVDYMSAHALGLKLTHDRERRALTPDEVAALLAKDGRAFNWSQLR